MAVNLRHGRATFLFLFAPSALASATTAKRARRDHSREGERPFARARHKDRRMKASTIYRDVILDRIARPKTHSVLFWWLFEHHDMVEELAGGARMSWAELCASFAEQGMIMTDRNGNPPKPGTARQTWWRVRKEKKRLDERRAAALAERAARVAANPRRNMPSRFPRGNYLRPVVAETGGTQVAGEKKKYAFRPNGLIKVIDNPSSALHTHQDRNLECGRSINDGAERHFERLGLEWKP
jgi:hypothetical protein